MLFLSFKETTHPYVLQISVKHNKKWNPLLYLLNYKSARSALRVLSLIDDYTLCFSHFLIIGLWNYSGNSRLRSEILGTQGKSEGRWLPNFTFNSKTRPAKGTQFKGVFIPELINNPLASCSLINLTFFTLYTEFPFICLCNFRIVAVYRFSTLYAIWYHYLTNKVKSFMSCWSFEIFHFFFHNIMFS